MKNSQFLKIRSGQLALKSHQRQLEEKALLLKLKK